MNNERRRNFEKTNNSKVLKMVVGSGTKAHHRDYTKHHRKCRSNGGTDENRNITLIPRKQHEAYHLLFQNSDPQGVCDILNKYFIDSNFILIPHRCSEPKRKEGTGQLKLFEDET